MATHRFTPTHYHTTIGPHESVLDVSPGDRVITTTVDALGCDATGKPVTNRGNPQTGPFFVVGAEPGDTLVVQLDRLAPNRDTAISGNVVAANTVDPWFARQLPPEEPVVWTVDREHRTVALAAPTDALARLTLPLRPMLGCVGVAPPGGQSISTATAGEHGGNMDYRGFHEGVTVYFPVFVEGALLHFGDGHATQGEGEIVGTGTEVSLDVEVTVDVRKGKRITWPRAEDDEFVLTVGNARPLDQALQHATTEMLRWLEEDYGLGVVAASTLLGQCVEYDVGNVFDPAYTMVCKVPKRILTGLARA
jgi:acetamidase/formamidase